MADLIIIQPYIKLKFNCLFCRSATTEVQEFYFQGMHVLADCHCETCKKDFYHTLPVGHDGLFPVSFDKKGIQADYEKERAQWLAAPLLDSFFKYEEAEFAIERKVFFRKENIIILNCLDSCFGHVFTKLINALPLIKAYSDMGVVVLLPKNMEWLVPTDVAETWTVDAPLNKLKFRISGLDKFFKDSIAGFTNVYLSPAYVHLDTAKVDIEVFVKKRPFDLADFASLTPQITFIFRDDRFRHGNFPEFFLYLLCVKLKVLRYCKGFFIYRQNSFFNNLARKIKHQQKGVSLVATGIGRPGGLSSFIKDRRNEKITETTEKEWCEIFAKSHIVIGVHGSNMLIPSSLAAGFIELLPGHKIPHVTEDLVLRHSSRYAVFLGRHLDLFAPAKLVAAHALSMIRDFPFLYKNTE